jgi:hypothetical protein
MRALRRLAVSGTVVHSGSSTLRTALASTRSTGVSRIAAQYRVSVMRHWSRSLGFFQPASCALR